MATASLDRELEETKKELQDLNDKLKQITGHDVTEYAECAECAL